MLMILKIINVKLGDVVIIEQSKPLSKLKRWRVKETIQQKAVKIEYDTARNKIKSSR